MALWFVALTLDPYNYLAVTQALMAQDILENQVFIWEVGRFFSQWPLQSFTKMLFSLGTSVFAQVLFLDLKYF